MTDEELLAEFLGGDRQAFAELVARYHVSLVRVARYYVSSEATAEDVAQETWIAVLRGGARFEGRSSFKTWLLRICANQAKRRGTNERRVVPIDPVNPVASSRFDAGGTWREAPIPFTELTDGRLDRAEVVAAVRTAITHLPEPQQSVVTLRDVHGLSTVEIGELLELSSANVRVLLHRGRARVREALESTLKEGQPWR